MKKQYVAPELQQFGSIHQITGVLVKSSRRDFVYGPSGETLGDDDDQGSVSQCIVVINGQEYYQACPTK